MRDAVGLKGTIVIVGAGASGRGHVGQLASQSGYDLVFVDRDRGLVDALRDAGQYHVRLVGPTTRDVTVTGFRAFHTDQPDLLYPVLCDSPTVLTAVCPQNLSAAADHLRPLLVRWLAQAPPSATKNILCCENMDRATSAFRQHLMQGLPQSTVQEMDRRVGFPNAMISRVVARPTDPLRLLGEAYSEWTADRAAFRGSVLPVIDTLELVDEQDRYLQRKLYIHNTGHATIGYLGFLKGYTYVHEAAADPDIMSATTQAIEESGWAIEQEHGFSAETILAYRRALTDKCPCAELPDELLRVVRDPMRKLGPDERFFGPIRLMRRHARQPHHLLYGPCAAMLADIPGDAESATIRQVLSQRGVAGVLDVLRVPDADDLTERIEHVMPHVRRVFSR